MVFMKSTRDKILKTLLLHPGSTILDLAKSVGINGISVRHHLTSLQAERMIFAEEERHGVGRPRLIYTLTELGMEQFPTNYLKLTNRLLEQIKQFLPAQQVDALFVKLAQSLAANYQNDINALSMDNRLDQLQDILAKEGFIIEWAHKDGQYEIYGISCPYYHIGLAHPEVCKIDQTIISTLLSKPLIMKTCMLNGDAHCTYVIDTSVEG